MLSASALPFTSSDLDLPSLEAAQIVSSHHTTRKREVQRHAADLVERDLITLNVDAFQMGVGGVHSWGARPHKRFMHPPHERRRLSFVLLPFDASVCRGRPLAVIVSQALEEIAEAARVQPQACTPP